MAPLINSTDEAIQSPDVRPVAIVHAKWAGCWRRLGSRVWAEVPFEGPDDAGCPVRVGGVPGDAEDRVLEAVGDGGGGDSDLALGGPGGGSVLASEGVVVGDAGDPDEGGEDAAR